MLNKFLLRTKIVFALINLEKKWRFEEISLSFEMDCEEAPGEYDLAVDITKWHGALQLE